MTLERLKTSPDARMHLTVEELQREHDKHAERLAFHTFNRSPRVLWEHQAELTRQFRVALWAKTGIRSEK